MTKRYFLWLVSLTIAVLLIRFIYLHNLHVTHAQEITLLSPPYFGTTQVWNIFDHEYPNYDQEDDQIPPGETGNMVHNNNQRLLPGSGNVYCVGYSGHDGIDYGLNYNYVRAAHSGKVNKAQWANQNHQLSYGLYVVLETTYNNITYETVYGHLSSILVRTNGSTNEGAIIGISGDTGNSTSPHLHFTVKRREDPNDPLYAVNPYGWNSLALDPWDILTNRPSSVNLWKSYPSISNYSNCTQLPYPDGPEIPYPVSGDPPLVPTITAAPYTTIIDDSTAPRFTTYGPNWVLQGCYGLPQFPDCWGSSYRSAPKSTVLGGTYATYTPNPDELIPGEYDLYAYTPNVLAHSNANLAHYYIYHNSQVHYAGINQQYFNKPLHPEPKWAYLGRYDFAGQNFFQAERVQVYHEGTIGEYLSADVVVFVFVDGPPDLDLQITQGSNDAGHNPNVTCSSLWGEAEIYQGHCSDGTGIVSGFRYSNVNIPANAIIKRAHLQFTVDGGTNGQPESDLLRLRFYGELNPASPSFDPLPPHDPLRPLTTAYKSWYVPTTDQWAVWQIRYSPDVGPIVQEIVHNLNPVWVPGVSALTFIVKPEPGISGSQDRRVMAYERDVDGTYDAHLLIWLACSTPPCPTQ